MNVKLEFGGKERSARVIQLNTLPRIGERLQSGATTFLIVEVIHTPDTTGHEAVVKLQRDGESK